MMMNQLDSILSYSDHPLTNKELEKLAPSIFTEQPHKSRSEKNFVPTSAVIDALRESGLEPVLATQMRSKQNPAHSKHMIRFRYPGYGTTDYSYELVLVNTNDGTSTYVLYAGIYRPESESALIVSEDIVPSIKVRHNQDSIKSILDGAKTIENMFKRVDARISEMKAHTLEIYDVMELAEKAIAIKYPDDTPKAITAANLLKVRRDADRQLNLWTVFSVIQENIIRGGLVGVATTNPDRTMKTKPIRNINENVRINLDLWTAADSLLPNKLVPVMKREKNEEAEAVISDKDAVIAELRKQLRAAKREIKALSGPPKPAKEKRQLDSLGLENEDRIA